MCSWYLDEPHRAILNDFVGEVLPNVDMLGLFPSADDVVAPFDARGVVLVYLGGLLLLESETVQRSPEVQNPQPAADAEKYSAPAVESAVVFCIFDFHIIGDLLYSITISDVDLRDELLPQSASAYPDKRSISFVPLRYLILKLGCAARYSMRWCRAAHCAKPADAQNRANCDTANEISNRIHVAAN
jgi:hypothetical protein